LRELQERLRRERKREGYGDSWTEVSGWLRREELKRGYVARRGVFTLLSARMSPRLAAALLATAVVMAACTWPVRQQEVIGYFVRLPFAGTMEEARGRLARLPWAKRVIAFAAESRTPGDNTLLLAAPRASAAEVQSWARKLDSLPGFGTPRVEALRERVTRPAYSAAAYTLFGLSFGRGELSEEAVLSRVYARAEEMGGTAVIVEQTDTLRGTTDVAILPQPDDGTGTRVAVFVPDSSSVTLVVVGIHPDGRADTLRIPLDTTGFATASDAERTSRLQEALRRNGFAHRLDVSIRRGTVQLRTLPRR